MADADTLPEALPLEPPDNGATLASVVLVPGDVDEQLELELLRRGQRGALEGHEEEEAALQPNGDRRDNAAVSDPRQEIGHPAHLQYLDLGDECEARENGDDHHHRLPEEQEEDHAILLGRDITQDFVAEADSARVIMLDVAPTLKRITLVVMPVFMAYAVLLSLQERLRRFLGITDSNSDAAHVFQFGVSLIFMGDLIFRLSHNVLLSFLRPRSRVYFAYFCVCVSMCIVVGAYYAAGSKSLTWVYIAYFVGGMGIGTFETNIVSCITPLGHKTKEAAIIGMPLGYNGVSIGAFAVFALCPSSVAIEAGTFLFVWVANMIGAFIFYTVPDIHFEASEDTAKKFILDIVRHWRQWLPLTWTYLACMFVNMFGVILMSGVVLYIFDSDTVKLLPVATSPSMSKDAFQMVYNVCAFLGDFTSRKVAYRFQRRVHPCWFLVLLAVGIALGLCRVALLAWPGMFLVMFANGALYATTTKFVDASVPHQFNLVVFSIWLFIGDCGSYVASSLTDYIAAAVG